MLNLKTILCYCICVLSPAWSVLSAAESDDATSSLAKKLSLLDTFSGEFQQTLVDDKGELLQSSSGDFFLQRPGFFRWDTKEPFPQLLVSDLHSIWMYDPDLEQVTVREYNDKVSATPALLLSGDVSKIEQHYTVTQQTDHRYTLTPKESQTLFNYLTVSFVNEQLSEMLLVDALGQTTTFRFIHGVYNQSIDRTLFEFTPPVGTDVIVGN